MQRFFVRPFLMLLFVAYFAAGLSYAAAASNTAAVAMAHVAAEMADMEGMDCERQGPGDPCAPGLPHCVVGCVAPSAALPATDVAATEVVPPTTGSPPVSLLLVGIAMPPGLPPPRPFDIR